MHPKKGAGMRIIKTGLFLTALAALAPSPPESEVASLVRQGGQGPSGFQMVSAAGQAFGDVSGFCARQPGVCETAQYVAVRLEAKAKYSVRLLYNWANEASSGPGGMSSPAQANGSDSIATGSTIKLASSDAPQFSQNTLKLEDLIPQWRGPTPVKKG
jgi:Family of unknown function (DUF5330)